MAFLFYLFSILTWSGIDLSAKSNHIFDRHADDPDSSRFQSLLDLSKEYLDKNVDSAEYFALTLMDLATENNNDRYIAEATRIKGTVNLRRGQYDSSIYYFSEAGNFYQKVGEMISFAEVLRGVGYVHRLKGRYKEALEFSRKSEEIYLAENDSSGLGNILNNIGIIYHEMGNYDRASEYYFKSLKLFEKYADDGGVAFDLNNLGMLYLNQGDYRLALDNFIQAAALHESRDELLSQASVQCNIGLAYRNLGEYDKADSMFNRALDIQLENDDQDRLAVTYINMGFNFQHQGFHDKAILFFQKALMIRRKNNQIKGEISALNALADSYLSKGENNKALQLAGQALQKSEKVGVLDHAATASHILAQAYSKLHDYTKAYEYEVLNKAYRDSIYSTEKSRQINSLRISYEVDKKEQEIELLNKTNQLQNAEIGQQKMVRNISIVLAVLIIGLGIVLFRNYRLSQEKKRLHIKARLDQEKMEARRLQELDETKSRFFSNIAHEFRTPLTLILGPSEQIVENSVDGRTQENARMIRQNADKLLSLTNQLLDLSKLESGVIRLQPSRSDLITFVKGCVHAFDSLADEKDIKLIFQSDQERLEMAFDDEKMAVVFNNLVSNALKFTEPFGEVKVSVNEKSEGGNPIVQIEIEDNGIGISEKALPYIFDRFYQVDDSFTRKNQGTGIGLALAKELVELHNGKIQVWSELNKGTIFTLVVPKKQEFQEPIEKETSQVVTENINWPNDLGENRDLSDPAKSFEEVRSTQPTILIVEDNVDVRKFIVNILNHYYKIEEAENGRKGLEKAIALIPDLIISDVMMPEMDGYEFCSKVKDDTRTSHIPIIMLTAKAGMDSKLEGLEKGADDYLPKPFNSRELLARIKNLISSRQKLQQKYSQTHDESLFAKKENTFISKLKKVIEQNIDKEEFGMDDLGRELAMSRTQVHRKLKALTNLSTSQFIRQYKLEKARRLLKSGEHNVSEVAYMLGFNTPNYFSTCFTEMFGYPPSEVSRGVEKG